MRFGTEGAALARLARQGSPAPDHRGVFPAAILSLARLAMTHPVCVHACVSVCFTPSGCQCAAGLVVRQAVMGVLFSGDDGVGEARCPVATSQDLLSSNTHPVSLLTLSFYEHL